VLDSYGNFSAHWNVAWICYRLFSSQLLAIKQTVSSALRGSHQPETQWAKKGPSLER
jgi:hypothetical protein